MSDTIATNTGTATGPKTPEGKEAIRFNALTYGLRTRCHLIPFEDPAELVQLGEEFAAEWQPQTHTERFYLEQMSTSQWLLARMAATESYFFQTNLPAEIKLDLLERVDRRRTRLERSFNTAAHELKQLQKDRRRLQAKPHAPVQAKPIPLTKQPSTPPPDYVMSDATQGDPTFASAATPDTR